MIILKILTNKYTYITLFLLTVVMVICILFIRVSLYKTQTEKLNIEIENLKIANSVLIKDVEFKKAMSELLDTFSNTTERIEKMKNEDLEDDIKNILLDISNNYYSYFTN